MELSVNICLCIYRFACSKTFWHLLTRVYLYDLVVNKCAHKYEYAYFIRPLPIPSSHPLV